jgi:hypothetical protein
VLISVFIVAAISLGLQAAGGKAALVAPTITAKPANPMSSTSATFAVRGARRATLQCQFEAAAFATCASPKSYTRPLAHGRHACQVKEVSRPEVSAPTSYSCTVGLVLPPAPSLTAKTTSQSNTASPSLSFSDSESGPAFPCTIDRSAPHPCPRSRSHYNLSQGAHSFLVRTVDAAANSTASTTWSRSIDSLTPPAPVKMQKQSGPTPNATNTFVRTEAEAGASFRSSLENGVWAACPSPCWHDITTSDNGPNQFAVRSHDSAGNVSGATFSKFKYQKGFVLPAGTVIAPQIRLKDMPTVNQDVCKNKSFTLSYIRTATN